MSHTALAADASTHPAHLTRAGLRWLEALLGVRVREKALFFTCGLSWESHAHNLEDGVG